MGWRDGGGTRKVGGLWLAGVGEYRGVDGAGALAGRPPAGACSCSRVGPALSLALARALALALALALGQGRSGAGRSGGQVVRGTRCGDVQADEPALGVQEGGVRAGGV